MSPRSRIFKCSGHHHPPVYIRLHSLCSFKKTPTFFYLQHQKMIISPEKPCFTYKTSQKILKSYKKIKCDCNLFWKINIKCFGVKFMKWFLKNTPTKSYKKSCIVFILLLAPSVFYFLGGESK